MGNGLKVRKLNIYAKIDNKVNHLVKDLNFSVECGKNLAIVGESGCGKTMTALAIFSLLPENCYCNGSIIFDETELMGIKENQYQKLRGNKMVFIPQSGSDFLNPVLTVKAQMREIIKNSGIKKHSEMDSIAIEKLENVGFDNAESIYNLYPFQLSGGMAQRVVLALSTINSPKLVIADEATRGIDIKTANIFLNKIDSLFMNSAKIIITHNIKVASRCDDILVMYKGKIVEYNKANEIIKNPQHEYTKALITAQNYKEICNVKG